ncbi:MAG: LysE family translocator [Chloroflexi bacterium]|nr:MAG: LysE family translocator [Chloroflexota bacterium]
MPDRIGVFMLAALVLVAIPGPDVLYITARGMDRGRLAGLISAWSAALGGLVLTLAAALGISTILESSALAFSAVKYLGAAYLIYLGMRRLLQRDENITAQVEAGRGSLRRVFAQGFLIAVLNPKTALFFVAFLPQFVNPGNGSIAFQLVLLGVIFVAIGLCTDTCYALVSGTVGNWLIRRRGFARGHRYLVGGTYLALGVGAAVSHPARAAL